MQEILDKIFDNRPTHDFEYNTVVVTIEQFEPGTAAMKKRANLIKLYEQTQQANDEVKKLRHEMTKDEFMKDLKEEDAAEKKLHQNFIECVKSIDGHAADWLTLEIVKKIFSLKFIEDCLQFAFGGSKPPDPEVPNEVDRFPETPVESGE